MSFEQSSNNPEQKNVGVYAEGLEVDTFEVPEESLDSHIKQLEGEIEEIKKNPERKGSESLETFESVLLLLKQLKKEKSKNN